MNYTSIEQSKKFLELGLKAETADACYDVGYGQTKAHIECENFISYFTNDEFPELKDRYIPCWSLGALMELMPKICEDENDGGCYPTLCKGYNTGKWHCVYRSTIYITDWYKSPTDAAFEMVVWLLENGYIKTEIK